MPEILAIRTSSTIAKMFLVSVTEEPIWIPCNRRIGLSKVTKMGYNYSGSNRINSRGDVFSIPRPDIKKGKFLMNPNDTTRPAFIALPPQAKDRTGQRFGRLVALGPVERTKKGEIKWLCRCDCGETVVVNGVSLRSGHTQSCGCLWVEWHSEVHIKHGLSTHHLYRHWSAMITRCTNPNYPSYVNYGGRGIAVCDEWRHDFKAFYDHVSKLPHCGEQGYTVDRIDNDAGYFPGNVQWATLIEQNRNQRRAHLVTYNGKTQCIAAWAEELGINYKMLQHRLSRGWSIEKALGGTP